MDLGFDLNDWEEAEAVEMGDREVLELGGHEIIVKEASLYTNEISGNVSVKVCVDINGKNEKQAGFFQKQYDNNKLSEAKWPSGATRYLSTKKECLQYTKGFVKSLENSNPGFKFDTKKDWSQIEGLKCAGVFGLEEYEDNEGKIRVGTKLVQFRSLDKLSEIKIPSVKTIDGEYIDYNDYKASKNKEVKSETKTIEITDNMLPF